MRAYASAKVGAAALAAGFVLAVIAIWREYPGWGPTCEGFACEMFLPPEEYAVKVSAALLTLLWTASVAIRSFPSRRLLASAVACGLGGAIAVLFLSVAVAPVFGRYRFPLLGMAELGAITGLVGALAAWCVGRWWPNKSLERTREG
jgi:hypothetical protein